MKINTILLGKNNIFETNLNVRMQLVGNFATANGWINDKIEIVGAPTVLSVIIFA